MAKNVRFWAFSPYFWGNKQNFRKETNGKNGVVLSEYIWGGGGGINLKGKKKNCKF
ncbi:hypothetical protein AGMMS50293_04210 [Spirochaetia bacterium]|nr:hypothetical protein AGMMS50293_04210 [Spirochaetia bacterium]